MAGNENSGNPATRFQPGQSGNPGGRPKTKPWTEALRRALKLDEQGQSEELDIMAAFVVSEARAGDKDFLEEIANRIEGRVAQQQVHTGDEDGGPVKHVHEVAFRSGI